MRTSLLLAVSAVLLVGTLQLPSARADGASPAGSTKGSATRHDETSRQQAVARAQVALPAGVTGAEPWTGPWSGIPPTSGAPVPVVVFLHGSSGLGLKAIGQWQLWLATLGIASIAPDSFSLPDRLTYQSPVAKDVYERIHALRADEAAAARQALAGAPWADAGRIILAGTSEGAVAVARHDGTGYAGRMIFAWSCEDNYFVDAHRTALAPDIPVLNVISASDPYFSPANGWLGNPAGRGHCATALASHKQATIVLIPGAPHTLLNLPATRAAVAGFLRASTTR